MADVWANSMVCHPTATSTLQGAATWQIQCHDPRATCQIAGCCHRANSVACHPRATYHIARCSHLVKSMSWSCHIAGCKNSIRHIANCFSPYFILFVFLKSSLGFDERRLLYPLWYTCFCTILIFIYRQYLIVCKLLYFLFYFNFQLLKVHSTLIRSKIIIVISL